MFVVYTPEGRNAIGNLSSSRIEQPGKINAISETDFSETMLEFDKDYVDRLAQHRHTHHALKQYQKQLDTMQDRHVVVTVGEIMSNPVLTLSPQSTIIEAWELMQSKRIQHLPVVEEGLLIGICSSQDILRRTIVSQNNQIESQVNQMIMDIANKEVVTTLPRVDIRRVAFVMNEYRIGALPVMSEAGNLIGIVTRSDLIKRLAKLPPLQIFA
jgi:acetoin utilization protein AcuB